jgi:hypothetical protein
MSGYNLSNPWKYLIEEDGRTGTENENAISFDRFYGSAAADRLYGRQKH